MRKMRFLAGMMSATIALSVAPVASVNSIIASINNFSEFIKLQDLKLKSLKIQRDISSNQNKEITFEDYKKLIYTAEMEKDFRLSLIIQTICSTGIRVSELKYITVEAILNRKATVNNKVKTRTILLSKELCKILQKYCIKNNIKNGSIFITKNGKPLDLSNICKIMKNLCKDANVTKTKVFPHNLHLRHLFAKSYCKKQKDISKLADILGHRSIETTRIYITQTFNEHIKHINKLNLVLTT